MKKKTSGFAETIAWLEGNKPLLAKVTYFGLLVVYAIGIPLWPAISTKLGFDDKLGVTLVIGAFTVHLGMIVTLLVDIHTKNNPKETWFQSHQASLPAVREVLDSALLAKSCCLVWIGVSMQSAWLALEQVFQKIEKSEAINLNITLLQSNPEFLRSIFGDNAHLAKITEGQWDYMNQRCKQIEPALRATQSKITLAQYSYMPNIHGLLIGDRTLFLSSVRWQGDELSVPREPFELLTAETNRGRYSIELYNSWLQHGIKSAEQSGKIQHYPTPQNPSPSRVG